MSDGLKRKAPRLAGWALAAGVACLGGVEGAQAQPFFGFFGYRGYDVPEMMSPELIYRRLVRSGYQPIGRIRRNGRVFLADVIDPRRRELRLVIDSFDGTILERYVLAARGPAVPDELPLRPPAPLADPNLPPPHLLPAPGARAEPEAPARPPKPRSAHRTPAQERPAQDRLGQERPVQERPVQNGETSNEPEPSSQASTASPAEPPHKNTAEGAAPRKAAAPHPPAPKTEGPGYANGVPINPLE